ncbi:MAG TPA: hypothetical protein VK525_21985 [Candidatus Saccharimonadales bacterium]|nr:hypothetical protein [Candidatus Saccharimonadales bacterium]
MKPVALRGTLIVLAHMIVLLGHGMAHSHLRIEPSPWQRAFILVVIFAAPGIAAPVLWTPWQKSGVVLLGLSLAGSLVFGLYYHFLAAGVDSVFNPIHTRWDVGFRLTAGLLALVEITGCAWCSGFWQSIGNSGFTKKKS